MLGNGALNGTTIDVLALHGGSRLIGAGVTGTLGIAMPFGARARRQGMAFGAVASVSTAAFRVDLALRGSSVIALAGAAAAVATQAFAGVVGLSVATRPLLGFARLQNAPDPRSRVMPEDGRDADLEPDYRGVSLAPELRSAELDPDPRDAP